MSRPRASTSVYHAIADPTRRRVLKTLRQGPRTVSQLERATGASQSALSQHLGVLRRARLVSPRRNGRHQVYRLARPTPLREVRNWIAFFDQFWDERLLRLGHYLERSR